MEYYWHGLKEYQQMYEQQRKSLLWPLQQEEVWGLEHPLVISLGKRSKIEEKSKEELVQDKINFVPPSWPIVVTDRGGLATLHSPGQLVIYPLISLVGRGWGPRRYVCQLLRITQGCLQQMGLSTNWDEAASGLFVGQNKICFIGLRVSGGRAYHGLSLNVSNDLSLFNHISSCGLWGRPITSLQEQGAKNDVNPEIVFQKWMNFATDKEML